MPNKKKGQREDQGSLNFQQQIRNSPMTVPPGEEEYINSLMPKNPLDIWRQQFLSLNKTDRDRLRNIWESMDKTGKPGTYATAMQYLLMNLGSNAQHVSLDDYQGIIGIKVKILEERCNYIFAPVDELDDDLGGKKTRKTKRKRSIKKRKTNKRKSKRYKRKIKK